MLFNIQFFISNLGALRFIATEIMHGRIIDPKNIQSNTTKGRFISNLKTELEFKTFPSAYTEKRHIHTHVSLFVYVARTREYNILFATRIILAVFLPDLRSDSITNIPLA